MLFLNTRLAHVICAMLDTKICPAHTMNSNSRLILAVDTHEAARARFTSAMHGQKYVSRAAVIRDPSRTPDEEQAVRSAAVAQACEMLAQQGLVLSVADEALARDFIAGAIDRAELIGVNA